MARALITITLTTVSFILGGWQMAAGFWGGMIYFGYLIYKDEEGGCW